MTSDVTRSGLEGERPDREAMIGGVNAASNGAPDTHTSGRRKRRRDGDSMVGEPSFTSYYGLPVLNEPTWAPLDIAGYLFLGGLAGASSSLAATASITGRPVLATRLKAGAAGAIGLSLVALVHDLGRPSRFVNMLRVFKPTSPMSVGSWLLAVYAPANFAAAGTALLGRRTPVLGRAAPAVGAVTTVAAGLLGPAVASYTSALVANTAVPAWHEGREEMPFVFVSSAASAAAGLGLVAAPLGQSGPCRRLGPAAAAAELAASNLMRRRMGMVGDAYKGGKAGVLLKVAEACTAGGAVAALLTRRSRAGTVASGALMLAGSALTRFGIFSAGVASVRDPRYVVEPQKERARARTAQ